MVAAFCYYGLVHKELGGSMKFGIRKPSLKKRIAARTSWKRVVRHSMGFKAPRGWGWLTNPKKAAYNRAYSRTTFDLFGVLGAIVNVLAGSSGKGRRRR
jgi:hypothetical protein